MFSAVKSILIASLIVSVKSNPINNYNELNDETPKNKIGEFPAEVNEEEAKIAEKMLLSIIEDLYDKFIEPNLVKTEKEHKNPEYSKYFDEMENEEKMMADFPATDGVLNADNENLKTIMATLNKNNPNLTNTFSNSVSFRNNTAERENAKQRMMTYIKEKILANTGRTKNITSIPPSITEPVVRIFNRTSSVIDPKNAESLSDGDKVNKKIRSFYSSCDIPRNTDEEVWKDPNTMNLFFNVDYNSGVANGEQQEDTVNVASATLRLYRLPQDSNSTLGDNCQKNNNAHSVSDEDKQLRASVYWYSRSLKKYKVKRRLADSRMIPLYIPNNENTTTPIRHYVEFNVRPAAKTWVRGRNLGLGIVVEDMDGNQVNPATIFKTPQCDTVGNVSTPIPIPTAVLDAHRNSFSLNQNITDAFFKAYDTMMPILDICTIYLVQNPSDHNQTDDTSKIICRMLKSAEDADQKTIHESKYKSTIENAENGRHIRHHHSSGGDADFRDKFVSKRLVMRNSQVHELNTQVQLQNISVVNR